MKLWSFIYGPPVQDTEVGLSCKKTENPKIGNLCFFVLPYFELLSSNTTLNFYKYRYILKYQAN